MADALYHRRWIELQKSRASPRSSFDLSSKSEVKLGALEPRIGWGWTSSVFVLVIKKIHVSLKLPAKTRSHLDDICHRSVSAVAAVVNLAQSSLGFFRAFFSFSTCLNILGWPLPLKIGGSSLEPSQELVRPRKDHCGFLAR